MKNKSTRIKTPMNRYLMFSFIFSFTILISCDRGDVKIMNPSEKLNVNIYINENDLKLDCKNSEKTLVNIDLGKFSIENDILGNGYQIQKVEYFSSDKTWTPVYGERSSVRDNYNEVVVILSDDDTSDKSIQLICRLYDEGLAFRYIFDETSIGEVSLNKEFTSFNFDNDYKAWVTDKAQGIYEKRNISKIENACERPLVIQQNDSSYLAIGEAALVDYARMKLICNKQKKNSLQIELDGLVDLNSAGYKTPWRYVMVADSPGKLLENNFFILNLNEPNKIEDTSWIKPGKVIREVTLTTKGGIACVDFAAKHNLQYVEFDAGWYGSEYDDASDASTITVDPKRSPGPLDLLYVIDYAKQKGIGIILYVNRRALEKQLDEILPLYKSWGVKGLKYGFVNVGAPAMDFVVA